MFTYKWETQTQNDKEQSGTAENSLKESASYTTHRYNSIAGTASVDTNSKPALRVVTHKSDIYSLFWAETFNNYSKLMHRAQTFLLTLQVS